MRQTILGHEALDVEYQQVWALYRDVLSPRALLDGLDDLVAERTMARRDTCPLAAAILQRVDRHGQWQGTTAGAGAAPLMDINAAVYAALEEGR